MLKLRHMLLAGTALQTYVLFANPAMAQAVTGPNLTVGAMVCTYDEATFSALLSLAVPLGGNMGAQFDANLGASSEGNIAGQAAGHLFWRDPATGEGGLYLALQEDGDGGLPDGFKLGAEGEIYLDRVTFSGVLGYNFGGENVFALGKLSTYLDENTKLYGGLEIDGKAIVLAGIEHQFAPNFSAFAEGRGGDDKFGVLAGLKFSFAAAPPSGPANLPASTAPSLIEHDREDVVPLWMQPCATADNSTVATTPPPTTTISTTPTTTAAPTTTPAPTTTITTTIGPA